MTLVQRVSGLVLLGVLAVLGEGGAVGRRGVREGDEIPEFFDDSQNVVILFIGLGIIVASVVVALLIYKLKGRPAAFENSLFQHLEDEA